ncbi:MAG: hypothetical protein WBJ21_06955 [Burkholderiaceae bacterium]|jgi:hypothetical protein
MATLQPFQNEADSITIGELTIENRLDQLELYGSLAISRDQTGLQLALELKGLIDEAVRHLQSVADLPAVIELKPTDSVDNPFK